MISYVALDRGIVNKKLSVLELDELNTLVSANTDAVENPDATPLVKDLYSKLYYTQNFILCRETLTIGSKR